MNSRDFRVLFSYEWKSKYNAAAASRNINVAFGSVSINERDISRWYVKFKIFESLTNGDRRRPEIIVDNEVLWANVEKKKQAILLEIMQKN